MGGLRKKTPKTFITFQIGALAISGIPGLSGFFSKDEVLWQAYSSPAGGFWFWFTGAIAAGLTAFYIFRLIFLTFYGEARWKPDTRAHESPSLMTLPLIILAFLSVFFFFVMTLAAAEVAVGLAIIVAMFRNKESINIEDMNLLKW